MKFKVHDIVVIRKSSQYAQSGVVALITHIRETKLPFKPGHVISVRFLSESPNCGSSFNPKELRPATMKEVTKAICKGLLPTIDEHYSNDTVSHRING